MGRGMFKSVAIEPTNACNLGCGMCYAKKRPVGYMDWNLFTKTVDEAKKHGIRRIGLQYGGEPTLHPQFASMVSYISSAGLKVAFSTNGSNMTPEIIEAVTDGACELINFSLHPQVKIEKQIAALKSIIQARKTSRTPKLTATVQMGEYADPFPVMDAIRPYVYVVALKPTILDMKWALLPPGVHLVDCERCTQPSRYMAVLWDGRVTICCRDIGGEMAFGNVRDTGLLGLWTNPGYALLRADIWNNRPIPGSLCENCEMRTKKPEAIP